jgi:hypothetical protein
MYDYHDEPDFSEVVRRAQRVPDDGYYPGTGLAEQLARQRRPNFVPARRHEPALPIYDELSGSVPPLPQARNGQNVTQINTFIVNSYNTYGTAPAAAPSAPPQRQGQAGDTVLSILAFIGLLVLAVVAMFVVVFIIENIQVIILGIVLVCIVGFCIVLAAEADRS